MGFRLVKLNELSGAKASIYTIQEDNSDETVFNLFLKDNVSLVSELNNILVRLKTMGARTGCRDHYFNLSEGSISDAVCAFYDTPKKHLRLYCLRFGNQIIILGGGAPKPKNVRRYQDDAKLHKEVKYMQMVCKCIDTCLKDGELGYSKDGYEFTGNLNFSDDDD